MGGGQLPMGRSRTGSSILQDIFFFKLRNANPNLFFDDFTKIKLRDRCADKQEFAIEAGSGVELISRCFNGH